MSIIKYLLSLTVLVNCTGCSSQNIPLSHNSDRENSLNYALHAKDTNTVIIKAFKDYPGKSSYVIFGNNRSIISYGVFVIKKDTIIRSQVINDKKEKSLLYKIEKEFDKLDQSGLNKTLLPANANGSETIVAFNNANKYTLESYRGNKITRYYSVAPEEYIDAKVTGYESREAFMKIFNAVDFSKHIKSPDIEKIKKQDTIFINFDEGRFQTRMNFGAAEETHHMYIFSIPEGDFIFKVSGNSAILKNVKKETNTIDFDFFLKYGNNAASLKKKKVFIIETDENGKKSITEVHLIFQSSNI